MANVEPPDLSHLPLRERKRLLAMRRVQDVAVALFEDQGFEAVTIEQVAAASEVSPSSVYRYFGTKEQLVIWDPHDLLAGPLMAQHAADATPLEAIRTLVIDTLSRSIAADEDRIRRRVRLAFDNPSIEAAFTLQAYGMAEVIGQLLASHLGRSANDLDVQVFAHAFVGGIVGGLRHWYLSGFTTPVADVVERPLAVLDRGLRLP